MKQVVNNFLVELDLFMKSNLRNQWICLDELKIYVRQSKRYHNETTIDCLDLATIEVHKRGTGLFTMLLDAVLERYENVFVESILEKRFYDFILSKGFEKYMVEGCLIRIKGNKPLINTNGKNR